MIIKIPIDLCEHLDSISEYNYNYYKLPAFFNDCDVVLEVCDEDCGSYDYIFGRMDEGAFKNDGKHLRFPSDFCLEQCEDFIIFDTNRQNEYNT